MRPAAKTSASMEPGVLARFDSILDARTLQEYGEDHLPGAISTPVLDEQEREQVGTIYKQRSPFDAKRIGAALVARNIARLLETLFAAQPKTWKPLVYCWRGGKRSGALAHVLREVGWGAVTLEGGYKAYRRHVVQRLAELPGTLKFRVLHGATGSGKSRLLRELQACGAQVLDLEKLAAHRGSVLGGLPEQPQPAQKMFESLVLHALEAMNAASPVFVEAESRKIGQLQVPEGLIGAMRAAECVRIDAGLATRVELLMEEYRHFFDDRPTLDAQLDCLVALHGRERIEDWKALGRNARWSDLVGRLLQEHYDPAYRRSASTNFSGLARAEVLQLPGSDDSAFSRLAKELTRVGASR